MLALYIIGGCLAYLTSIGAAYRGLYDKTSLGSDASIFYAMFWPVCLPILLGSRTIKLPKIALKRTPKLAKATARELPK